MKITILAVGKIKEKFYRDAVAEFQKRLSRYCRLQILEVEDEKTPDGGKGGLEEQILRRETSRLLPHIRPESYCIVLAIRGKKLDSVAFSRKLSALGLSGKSDVLFVIGGSLGLHPSVLERADECLSFSDMTFPHQLMRVILLEQIYRGFRIAANEPYHK